MDNLKPCPFCGRKVEIEDWVDDEPVTFADCGFLIRCTHCGFVLREHTHRLPGINKKEDSKAKKRIVQRWNRRKGGDGE